MRFGYTSIKMLENFFSFNFSPYITFPNAYNSPAGKFQINIVGIISGNIQCYLMPPKINIRFRHPEIFTPFMTMPKTSVNKNHRLIFLQNNIRRPWELSIINAKPETTREKILPHYHLRLRILPLYRRHIPAPLLRCLYVCHIITSFYYPFINIFFSIAQKIFSPLIVES